MPLLLALLWGALVGPHAADAALHAHDPEAQWVRAAPLPAGRSAATTVPALARRVYGYLPYWESIDLNSFRWDLVSEVIAFSAEIGTDGAVANAHALPGAALVAAAHAHGVKVHLCATLFNSSGGGEIATFLGSATAQGRAVQELVAIATSAGLDGLNLDFEFVPSGSRSAFTGFVQQLHAALRGAIPGAELTLAMPATTAYTGYDAAALSAASERLLLMEYDYHWRTAPVSGANAPLPSVTAAVDGFLAAAPAASIAMGVPYYGWDWPTATASPGSSTTAGGASVLFSSVFANFAAVGRLWDAGSQTPWYAYAVNGQQHQAWVEDDQSLALKYQAVNGRNLAGIMIWALGYDAGRAEAWDAIQTAFGNAQPPPTAPGVLRLVSVTFTPAAIDPGGAVTAAMHVKNVGGQSIQPAAPGPSLVYDEPQSAAAAAQESWRLAVDVADRPASQPERPWRWGLAQPLAPGAEADLSLQVRLERGGTRRLWAAVVHEGVDLPQDLVAQTDIFVALPGGPGAGSTAPPAAARGCAQTDEGPLLALAGVLALIARRRGLRRPLERG